jgi:PAS domain S-box-containing protein
MVADCQHKKLIDANLMGVAIRIRVPAKCEVALISKSQSRTESPDIREFSSPPTLTPYNWHLYIDGPPSGDGVPKNPLSAILGQKLLAKLPAGAYLCDADGLIVYFNDHAVDVWGRAPRLNDSIDRFCGSFRLFHSDGRPMGHDECWMALALKTGQDYIGQEIILERPDGSRRTVLAHASPVTDDDGILHGAVNILVDITDRKEAERESSFLSAIVESSDDAIISKSLDGIIQSWNRGAQRIFGYSAAEAIGQSITLLIPSELVHEEHEIISRLRRGERIDHFETTRVAKDGRHIDISVTISPIRDASGKIIGASKVARDITPQKLMEAERRDGDRRKNEFLATLAHELRNPLAAVCNSLQLLALDDSLSPTVVQIREIMDAQGKQLIRLVDDLLDASRIARGQIELRREVVDLASIVTNAVQASRLYIDRGKHQLAITRPSLPVFIDADPARLVQVLSNLLCNAAKYTPPGGQIWLSGRRVADGVELSVRDNGVGIAPDMLPRVFDLYMQVESSKPNAIGGLGLGLALAKQMVELHGGRISVSSEEGQGSVFHVWLPASAVEGRQREDQPVHAPTTKGAQSVMRILIVDDTHAASFVLGRLISKLGHQVETAEGAISAIEAIVMKKPDVVISDIEMPGLNGYDLARRLRQMPEMDGVMLVALTGYAQESDRAKSREAGFDRHLVKPISMSALQELLGDAAAVPAT